MNKTLAKLLVTLVVAAVIVLIIAFPAMWLWNGCLLPAITVLKPVGYWQMVGIITFSTMIASGRSSLGAANDSK